METDRIFTIHITRCALFLHRDFFDLGGCLRLCLSLCPSGDMVLFALRHRIKSISFMEFHTTHTDKTESHTDNNLSRCVQTFADDGGWSLSKKLLTTLPWARWRVDVESLIMTHTRRAPSGNVFVVCRRLRLWTPMFL